MKKNIIDLILHTDVGKNSWLNLKQAIPDIWFDFEKLNILLGKKCIRQCNLTSVCLFLHLFFLSGTNMLPYYLLLHVDRNLCLDRHDSGQPRGNISGHTIDDNINLSESFLDRKIYFKACPYANIDKIWQNWK